MTTEQIQRLKQLYIDAIANAQDIDAIYNDRFADAQARIDAIHAEFSDTNAELIALRNATHGTIANTEQAKADGAFGVPTLVIHGHAFWGVDTIDWALDYLDRPDMFEQAAYRHASQLPSGL